MRTFTERTDAGRRLGEALAHLAGTHPLVLAIPRGGVPVAAEVARAIGGTLDVIVARKVGSPESPELAIGAVTADGARYLHRETIEALHVPDAWIERAARSASDEARAREAHLRQGRPAHEVAGRTVVIVDDGLATGSTMIAAARAVRRRHPAHLVVAVPVGAASTMAAMRDEADEVTCLAMPEPFEAVGLHYVDFGQVTDAEVDRLLAAPQLGAGAPRRV